MKLEKKTKKGVSYIGRHAGTWFLHFIIDHILTNSRIQLCFKSVKNFTLNMEIDLTVMMEIDEMFSGIKSCNLRLSVLKNYFIYSNILVHRKNIDFIRLRL